MSDGQKQAASLAQPAPAASAEPVLCVSSKEFRRLREADAHIKAWLPPINGTLDMLLYAAPVAAQAPQDEHPAFVIYTRPGMVPQRKGPYPTTALIEAALRELQAGHPDATSMVIRMPDDCYPESGVEWIDMHGDKRKGRLKSAQAPQNEREAFEAWQILQNGYEAADLKRGPNGGYCRVAFNDDWYAWQARAALAAQAPAVPLLAAEHKGMRVDYSGMLMQAANALVRGHKESGLAEMLRQFQGHMTELGLRWYAGDTAVVDELLQLYCVAKDSREACKTTAPITSPAVAPTVPEGWKLVPVEQTEEMLAAGVPDNAIFDAKMAAVFRKGRIATWKHMLAAAPQAPTPPASAAPAAPQPSEPSASAQQAVPVAKRLIGWRTSDYLMETSDREKAKNWEVHHEMLPVFEGDPDTKLSAPAPSASPAALTEGQREAILEVMALARDEGLPGTAETLQSILAASPVAPPPADCPRCGKPAPMLFEFEGTRHCGCLHTQDAPAPAPAAQAGEDVQFWKRMTSALADIIQDAAPLVGKGYGEESAQEIGRLLKLKVAQQSAAPAETAQDGAWRGRAEHLIRQFDAATAEPLTAMANYGGCALDLLRVMLATPEEPAAPQPSAKALTDDALMQIAEQHGWVIKQTGRTEWLVCSTNTPGNFLALARAILAAEQPNTTFQDRVQPWMLACFGAEIAADTEERNHRFLEEALELVQACGATASEAHQLVDYVYGRPVGDKNQEVGGVMVTLAALCLAQGLDMHAAGETELARIWTKVEQIRTKQAAKPKHSPLPQHVAEQPSEDKRYAERYRWLRERNWNESALFVVQGHHSLVRLGTDCPSGERLDAAIDAAIAKGASA